MKSNAVATILKAKSRVGALCALLLIVFSLVLSACGAAAPKSNPNQPLTIVGGPTGDMSRNFSPLVSSGAAPGTQGMIYETLLMFNLLKGTTNPWLASSYQVSPDATTITFHTRPGVKWSDGQAFTANDVAFTFQLLKQYPAADGASIWARTKSVMAVDASTVAITLKQPYSPMISYIGGVYIVPQHLWANVGDPTRYANPNPVGTGPFLFSKFTPQLVTLTKNPNYWQPGKPLVNKLLFPAYNSNQSVELDMDHGNIDWTGLFSPNIQQTYVSRDPAHFHYWFPPSNTALLYLNLTRAPFNQLAVRQAISLALDRQKMVTVGESGYSQLPSPTGLVLPNQQSYLAPQYNNVLLNTVNTVKANQLMQEAGFTKGSDGFYTDKSGKKLTFSVIGVSGWTDEITNDQIIADNLKQIGMNVSVNAISYSTYFNDLQTGNFDMALNGSTNGLTPFYFFDALLNSKDSAPIGQAASTNWERWQNPATDQLLNQYASTSDINQQKQIVVQLETLVAEQLPAIPLFYGVFFYEYSTAHFTGWPTENNPFIAPAPWKAPECEFVVLNLKPV